MVISGGWLSIPIVLEVNRQTGLPDGGASSAAVFEILICRQCSFASKPQLIVEILSPIEGMNGGGSCKGRRVVNNFLLKRESLFVYKR